MSTMHKISPKYVNILMFAGRWKPHFYSEGPPHIQGRIELAEQMHFFIETFEF